MKINWPLLALAVGAFGIGTTEFARMGALAVIAGGLDVSIPKAGLLVTGYALGVLFGAPLLTLPTGRIDRKLLLVGLMALFTAGNVMAARRGARGRRDRRSAELRSPARRWRQAGWCWSC